VRRHAKSEKELRTQKSALNARGENVIKIEGKDGKHSRGGENSKMTAAQQWLCEECGAHRKEGKERAGGFYSPAENSRVSQNLEETSFHAELH